MPWAEDVLQAVGKAVRSFRNGANAPDPESSNTEYAEIIAGFRIRPERSAEHLGARLGVAGPGEAFARLDVIGEPVPLGGDAREQLPQLFVLRILGGGHAVFGEFAAVFGAAQHAVMAHHRAGTEKHSRGTIHRICSCG